MPYTLETQYVSAERKQKTGNLILRDEDGDYIGKIVGNLDVIAAFEKSGLAVFNATLTGSD